MTTEGSANPVAADTGATTPQALAPAQVYLLDCVRKTASERAQARETDALAAGTSLESINTAVSRVRQHARLEIAFSLTAYNVHGKNVADEMLRTGRYFNAFETANFRDGIDDCTLKMRIAAEAKTYGARTGVISRLGSIQNCHRPSYGLLNYRNQPVSTAGLYGSARLILHPVWRERCTFTAGDSFTVQRNATFTWEHIRGVLCSIAGATGQRWCDFVLADTEPTEAGTYIEAQILGPIHLDRDVSRLLCPMGLMARPDVRAKVDALRAKFQFAIETIE